MSNNYQASSISIKDVSISFGSTKVIKKINLEIKSGEFFSFLGPSGSGKSTLLRAIAGFGPTPEGSIKIGGEDVVNTPTWERNVGLVFQNYALWPHMSVRKNVAFGLEEQKISSDKINRLVDEALDLVELKHFGDRMPAQLSGGQQQRIALARTVVVKPKVLLLDEPLSNLDANLRVQMRRDILALQRRLNITTIFVTHDQEEANTISDRIALFDDGIIQQVGTPVELYDYPCNHFVASFLGNISIIHGKIIDGVFQTENGLKIKINEKDKGPVDLIIRPQSILLSTASENNKDQLVLDGKIKSSEFLGGTVRYFIDVQGHEIIVDKSHQRSSAVLNNDKKVQLAVSRNQISFF